MGAQSTYYNPFETNKPQSSSQKNFQNQLSAAYQLDSITEALDKLVVKTEESLRQETMSMIYIESKRKEMSMTIFTLFSDIDQRDDGVESGCIEVIQFIDAIRSTL